VSYKAFDSNVFVQESLRVGQNAAWMESTPRVILSEAKDLFAHRVRSFASLRMTRDGRFVSHYILLSLDELMVQYVGINDAYHRPYLLADTPSLNSGLTW